MELTHVREVFTGLVLSLLAIALTGVVAFVDPFNTGQPWISWVALASVSLICIAAVTWSSAEADNEMDLWTFYGCVLATTIVLGAIIGWMVTGDKTIQYPYGSVVWGAYASGIISVVLSSLTTYLVVAMATSKASVRSLREVA